MRTTALGLGARCLVAIIVKDVQTKIEVNLKDRKGQVKRAEAKKLLTDHRFEYERQALHGELWKNPRSGIRFELPRHNDLSRGVTTKLYNALEKSDRLGGMGN